jgi:hypothetical protein
LVKKGSRKDSLRTVKKTLNPRSLKNLRPWSKGESGNPGGRPKQKPMLDALHEALMDQPELLKKIALNALRQASCDHRFFCEIRDMLDGKPGPKIESSDDAPLDFHLNVNFIDPPDNENQ